MLILKKSPMELQSIIGLRKTEEGKDVRMNRIALEQIKHLLSNDFGIDKKNLVALFFNGDNYTNDELVRQIVSFNLRNEYETINLEGIGIEFHLSGYKTDYLHGICMDGDTNCIRLVKDDGKVIKKKIGKVVREYLEPKRAICDSAKTYVCEHVAKLWKAYATEHQFTDKYTLVVDDDFDAIYSSSKRIGDFHSCMTNMDCVVFYNEVDACAASLRDENDMIVARCVVFNEVYDLDGNKYRYAERQYSTDQDLTLQQLLVNMLYKEGYIDINKQVGASCSDSNNVVDKNGNSMRGTVLYIEHCFDSDDYCPYMDGFAYYSECDQRMYNNSSYGGVTLHETSGRYPGGRVCERCGRHIDEDDYCWSDYYNMELCEDCAIWSDRLGTYIVYEEAVEVYHVDGSYGTDWMPKDSDEITEINGRYYWDNELVYCECDGELHLPDDVCYDEIKGEDIPYEDSVEYKYMYRGRWEEGRTHEDNIGDDIVEIDDEYYLKDDCEWDEINQCWVQADEAVEYLQFNMGDWDSHYTRDSEEGMSIVDFEGDYYLKEDCFEIDGEWYPCDQLPDNEYEVEEEEIETVC